MVFETLAAAKADLDKIRSQLSECDQLNVVIKAESTMDDPEILGLGKVKIFAGAAWSLIHERRVADGWYQEPH